MSFYIHRDGFKFISIFSAISIILFLLDSSFAFISVILTLFCIYFFRNPKRVVPKDENLIVSTCDGTVSSVNLEVPPSNLGLGEKERYRVSVFLSIFNVHVNRLPASGRVRDIFYHQGAFINASLDKSSILNERNTIVMELNNDQENLIAFTQIAGLIARRIVCYTKKNDFVSKGEVFGLIRFGSRCDIWLPVGAIPLVFKGQTMVSGESIISDISIKNAIPKEGATSIS